MNWQYLSSILVLFCFLSLGALQDTGSGNQSRCVSNYAICLQFPGCTQVSGGLNTNKICCLFSPYSYLLGQGLIYKSGPLRD